MTVFRINLKFKATGNIIGGHELDLTMDICIAQLLARFELTGFDEDQIGIFLKAMIRDAIRITVQEDLEYDEGLETQPDYNSISMVRISVLHILPYRLFETRFRSNPSFKNFYDTYQ